MIGNGPLRGFAVEPRSIRDIREIAQVARKVLGLPDGRFNLADFVESLHRHGIDYDIIEDTDVIVMPKGVEACCIPEQAMIYFRASTYDGIRRGAPRALFTVFHELGHLILGHRRTLNRGGTGKIEVYEDSEWQANAMAAEITMPLDVILARSLRTAADLQVMFGVSKPAAVKRIGDLTRRGEI